jgi:hypothetical protein
LSHKANVDVGFEEGSANLLDHGVEGLGRRHKLAIPHSPPMLLPL